MNGKKLRREVACLACGTIQHADNEFCEKCRCNLFDTVGCDQCIYGPPSKENIDSNKCILVNQKDRCMKFQQKNLNDFKRRVQESEGKTKIE